MRRVLAILILLNTLVSCKVYETTNKDKSDQRKEFIDFFDSFKKQEPNASDELILNKVTSIEDKFINSIKEEGVTIPYSPKVIVVNTPALMSYWGDRNFGYLLTPNWETADQNMKNLFQHWVDESGIDYSAEQFFIKNFNWFLVPHELAHFLQETQKIKRVDYNDRWDGEIYANQVAVSFWISQGKEKELTKFIENTTKIMNYLKSPNTSDISEKEFFNQNNRELAQDPNKYAYYQFLFYKMAFDQKDKYDEISINVVK